MYTYYGVCLAGLGFPDLFSAHLSALFQPWNIRLWKVGHLQSRQVPTWAALEPCSCII